MILKIVLFLLLFINLAIAEDIPQGIQDAAKLAINEGRFKTLLRKDFADFWEPGKLPKLSEISVGQPFPTYTIDDSAFIGAKEDTPISALIKKTEHWVVPIMNKNKIALRFEVRKKNRIWEVGTMGAALFALGWQKVLDEWPESKGYHPIYIRVGGGPYFAVPEVDDFNLTEVKLVFDGKGKTVTLNAKNVYSHLTPSSAIIKEWKNILRLYRNKSNKEDGKMKDTDALLGK